MSKLGRKIRRTAAKQKKKLAEKEMVQKVALFNEIPNECLVCLKPFDKKDKEMVQSWCVVVRRESKKVNLYCPDCWSKATGIIQQLQEEINDN
tara:strand:- start:161 stop:439 length:279 start_codon:yes stop_codon:yes gene_type:complete